jgi:uncharacterized protein (TIGR03067 family)
MDLVLEREQVRGEAAQRDRQRLQGTWNFIAGRREAQLSIVGDRYTMVFKNGEVYKGSFQVDPNHHPREMDLNIEEGPNFLGLIARAIYELDGAHLIWNTAKPGDTARPRIFPEDPANDHLCIVFRHEKPHS